MRNAALTLALAAFGAHADSAKTATRSVTVLADGIYQIRHPDAPDGFPQGNTTVVIGERRVLVVDSCLLPSSARQDIADIRRWTPLSPADRPDIRRRSTARDDRADRRRWRSSPPAKKRSCRPRYFPCRGIRGGPLLLDVARFKRQFGGDDKDNQDVFDESFEGLVKTAVEQIALR